MYLEYIIPASVLSWVCSPVPTCANTDTVINTDTYITIQNLSTSSQVIELSFDLMKFE